MTNFELKVPQTSVNLKTWSVFSNWLCLPQLFMKRYYKTKHGTYIPTLREYWKPGMTWRELSSAGSKRRWWNGFSSLVPGTLTVATLVFSPPAAVTEKPKVIWNAAASVADGFLLILGLSSWKQAPKYHRLWALRANKTLCYFKLLLYSLLESKEQTISGLSLLQISTFFINILNSQYVAGSVNKGFWCCSYILYEEKLSLCTLFCILFPILECFWSTFVNGSNKSVVFKKKPSSTRFVTQLYLHTYTAISW